MTAQRQILLSMIRGDSGQEPVYQFRFGEGPERKTHSVPGVEVRRLLREGQDSLFLLGVRPEDREDVLRNSPCLVRQEDGRFVAMNTDREGPVYLVD